MGMHSLTVIGIFFPGVSLLNIKPTKISHDDTF